MRSSGMTASAWPGFAGVARTARPEQNDTPFGQLNARNVRSLGAFAAPTRPGSGEVERRRKCQKELLKSRPAFQLQFA